MNWTDPANRARRGAALLDKAVPNWWDMVNLDDLDMSAGRYFVASTATGSCGCVLAQLDARRPDAPSSDDGTYSQMLEHLGLSLDEAYDLGFNAIVGPDYEEDYDYELLEAAWTHEVRSRIASAAARRV